MILILMGVSGVGKTTLGKMLSVSYGWPFLDADDFHPPANKAKMASGHPLNDVDRAPWLAVLHATIKEYARSGNNMVMACSALKEQYRQALRGSLPDGMVRFVMLEASPTKIADHLLHREHEFMNPDLLKSQLATLQQPSDAWLISVEGEPEDSLMQIEKYLHEAGAIALP